MEKFCPGHSNFTLHRNLFKLADICTRADIKFQPNYAVYLNVSCQCVLQLPHLILSKTQPKRAFTQDRREISNEFEFGPEFGPDRNIYFGVSCP